METRGEYRGVRWDSIHVLGGERLIRVRDSLGLGLAYHYATLAELQAAVDAAIEREGEDVRLAGPDSFGAGPIGARLFDAEFSDGHKMLIRATSILDAEQAALRWTAYHPGSTPTLIKEREPA